jgi:hypothetical protein
MAPEIKISITMSLGQARRIQSELHITNHQGFIVINLKRASQTKRSRTERVKVEVPALFEDQGTLLPHLISHWLHGSLFPCAPPRRHLHRQIMVRANDKLGFYFCRKQQLDYITLASILWPACHA